MPRRLPSAALLALLALPAFAQEEKKAEAPQPPDPLTQEAYILPPPVIDRAVRTDWAEQATVSNMSPDRTLWFDVVGEGLARLADVRRPFLNLAGLQVDPSSDQPRGWTLRRNRALRIHRMSDLGVVEVKLPAGVSPQSVTWSPDSKRLAFIGASDSGSHLYVADAVGGQVRRVGDRRLMGTLSDSLSWSSDSRRIAAVFMPEDRPKSPEGAGLAPSPWVRVADPAQNAIRTFPDRLEDPSDAQLFRHFTTGRLGITDLNGRVSWVGEPGMIQSVDASPDLDWFRVTTGVEPFTYTFPASSFARREALVSADGKEAAELSRRNLPGARPARSSGRRALAWHPAGDGMVFLFKDDKTKKDSIRHWTAPFGEKDVKVLWESETDIASAQFTSDMASLLVRRTEKEETVFDLVPLAGGEPVRVFAFKPGDFYANPGDFVTLPGPKTGRVVLRDSEGRFLLSGTQYDKDPVKNPPRPFLDRVKIGAEKPERIWQSPADAFETATVMDDSVQTLLITRQTATETPNSHMLTLAGKSSRQLTFNKDLLPEVTQLRRERIQITRADGFKFWTEVIMPRFAINGVGRKAFFWFYPSEVVDQKSYDDGERTLNLNAFRRTTPNSAQLLALLGYVVVLPDCPIVGPSDRPNDTYPLQLRNNLWAVVDELDRRELIDRRYLAIGGHSYGAFSTAHAMIQTPFFKAGIAGAGNYNRTLTPFGFQREQRKLWDNAGMYVEMSPIMRADQLTGALLMYHGADDQNVGTFPINSLRMFDALEALGKTASLYVYPGEDHGQIALETRLDMWARWIAWLEKYVK